MKSWKPRGYQRRAVEHLAQHPGAGLFLRPGLGKTSCTLAFLEVAKRHGLGPTLVVAPLRVCYSVWRQEATKWGSELTFALLHGKNKASELGKKADIYLINPEGLDWLVKQGGVFDIIVLDESSKFKNARTLRYKNLERLRERAKRVIALTGTPAANHLQDVWAQVKLLDGGLRLHRHITRFRQRYFFEELIRIGGGRTVSVYHPRPDTAERIQEQIKDICLYMSDTDYLDLPTLTFNNVSCPLPKSAWHTYDHLAEELFAEVRAGTISASTAAVKVNKLRQICSGSVYGDDITAHLHTAKDDALVDLIEESGGEPVLVGVAFQHEANRIAARLRQEFDFDAPYLGGGISAARSDEIVKRWNSGEIPVLLAHPSSVAHGLNLQAGGRTIVWCTLPWSMEEYDQFNRRVYRQGQTQGVIIHHLLADDTIDLAVLDSLNRKDRTQQSLLNLLKDAADGARPIPTKSDRSNLRSDTAGRLPVEAQPYTGAAR